MKPNRLCLFIIAALLVFDAPAQKQKSQPTKKTVQRSIAKKTEPPRKNVPASDPAQDEKKVRDMVAFLSYMLNTLGSSNTSARDKDVLVTESYSKIFRDAKVQVEDDLAENRSVITNKDVVAYLKDINFFFKDVKFEFTIDKIDRGVNADNHTFYKVSLHRNLSGTTSEGNPITNTVPRYIEVNFNPKDQDLKIVSIYTKEFDEKASLTRWWKELSLEWQSIFRKKFHLSDSVSYTDIKRVTLIDELELAGDKFIQSFEPLLQLKNLRRLNLSQTSITDLSPIRNLGELVELNLSHTAIRDLSPLRYLTKLMKLNLNTTEAADISVVQRMPKLLSLDLGYTGVTDLAPLMELSELSYLNLQATKISGLSAIENLTQITELNISRTSVQDISSIALFKNLVRLNCDSSRVQNFSGLSSLDNLKVLYANSTSLTDLQPLQKLQHLEKVYCDQTPIKKSAADAFMLAHPRVTVVYGSHDLKMWWSALSPDWKEVISKATKINADPSSEELTRIGNLDSINLTGRSQIKDLEPLLKFQRLRVVIARKTSVHDLVPIKDHREIKFLDVSETNVSDLSPVAHFTKLQTLKADGCQIGSIDGLQKTKTLQKLYVDATSINDINAAEFLQSNPKCLLIYKTVHLTRWWRGLSDNWKEVFLAQIADTTRESMHRLVEQESFHFKDSPVGDLSGLSEFVRLRDLRFSGTTITEVVPTENLKMLKSLQASSSPIQNVRFLGLLGELEDLDISNTPIEDLSPVWTLQKLKNLNCAGTQIRRLDAIEKLESLEQLDCSNTNVSKLTPLDYLKLKSLKCYNTRVSNRSIENFIASHPKCKVVYYR